jgi:RNA polymerase primary sigma factor
MPSHFVSRSRPTLSRTWLITNDGNFSDVIHGHPPTARSARRGELLGDADIEDDMRQSGRIRPAVPDSLTEYLDSIGHYRLLKRSEEIALGRRIRAGSVDAVHQLVCANLRFVVSLAKQYQRQGVSLLDLIHEGNLGLIRAASRYDERKGIKFISYAVWWIRQAIFQALMEQSRIIHLPTRRAANVHRIGRSANALFQQLEREPRQSEIADELAISEDEVARTMSFARLPLSLDAPLTGDDNTLLDYVADDEHGSPDDDVFESARTAAVSEALSTLRPRDAQILRMYFGFGGEDPLTLEEIGSRLGITRERVRQVRDRALRTLRKTIPHLALAG